MVNYKDGKIYGIYYKDLLVYIGSTTQKLSQRMADHIIDARYYKDKKTKRRLYNILNDETKNDFKIKLIEYCSCDTREELMRKEGEHQRLNADTILNLCIAGRTPKEYYDDNRERLVAIAKKYHEDNRDLISIKNKLYRENNKEKIIAHNKIKYQQTKEQVKEPNKIKRATIKICECNELITTGSFTHHLKTKEHEEALQYKNDKILPIGKIECECGSLVIKDNICRHRQSKKHLNKLTFLKSSPE